MLCTTATLISLLYHQLYMHQHTYYVDAILLQGHTQ